MMRHFIVCLALMLPGVLDAQVLRTSSGLVRVTPVLSGLDEPWAVDFLPDGTALVTERGGKLLVFDGQSAHRVTGTPRVAATGQGGLLDVLVPRDFDRSRQIFLTFSRHQEGGAGTALAVARLDTAGRRLTDLKILFEAAPNSSTGRHFGSRVIEAADGTLYMTLGDRGQGDTAQDLSLHQGSVIRINRDGSVPGDNPFVSRPNAQPQIWSYGHRNAQGLAQDRRGRIWAVEHGAKGGDEVNLIRKGANYGWPVISYGTHYSGAKIGVGTRRAGLEQPAHYWDPSIAPSGMMIYSGKLWPKWKDDIFIGSLKFDYIARLDGSPLMEREKIKGKATDRVRDIRESPDGSIWFLSVGEGTLFRLTPATP